MDSLVGDVMNKVYKWIQKNYPIIMLLFVIIIGSILWGMIEFGAKSSKKTLYNIVEIIFYSSPILCIVITILVIRRFMILSKDESVMPYWYLSYSLEIKRGYNDIHKAFLFIGIVCLIPVYTSMLSVLLFFVGASMLIQTGFISKVGFSKLYKTGLIDKKRYIKYIVSQYILFKDVKTLNTFLKENENIRYMNKLE